MFKMMEDIEAEDKKGRRTYDNQECDTPALRCISAEEERKVGKGKVGVST